MRTVLVCHEGTPLNEVGLARWLASFSELAGMVILKERGGRRWNRLKRERQRVGWWRLLDVLAFRAHHRLFLAAKERRWAAASVAEMCHRFESLREDLPVLRCASINSKQARDFIAALEPDVMVLRCKQLLKPDVFRLPRQGAYVFHPGICPQYRNAHGCFWALAQDDLEHVGMTMLRIDEGIDTGPIYGYFSYEFDEITETPFVIQQRVVLDNLDALRERLLEIHAGTASTLDPGDVDSAVWGQPRLSRYLAYKRRARRRQR